LLKAEHLDGLEQRVCPLPTVGTVTSFLQDTFRQYILEFAYTFRAERCRVSTVSVAPPSTVGAKLIPQFTVVVAFFTKVDFRLRLRLRLHLHLSLLCGFPNFKFLFVNEHTEENLSRNEVKGQCLLLYFFSI
jgi:hypothetical protein